MRREAGVRPGHGTLASTLRNLRLESGSEARNQSSDSVMDECLYEDINQVISLATRHQDLLSAFKQHQINV